MPYEPNASGILTTQEASQMGREAGGDIVKGVDAGVGITQQLIKSQMMRQQLQQQLDEHKANMVNTMGQGLYELAAADDDQKKDPIWKAKRDYYIDGMAKIGMNADPNAVNALLQDPTHSKKLATAISALNNSDLDPIQKAQALAAGGPYLGGIAQVTKTAEAIADAQSKLMQSGIKNTNTTETMAKGLRDKVQMINSKIDTSQGFANEAKNILSKWSEFKTGAAETALKDAYNKALSGGAPRSFTLAMMDENRGIGAKLDGYFSKIENGVKLTDPERKDMAKALDIMKADADSKRYEQLTPYYNATKSLKKRADDSKIDFDPNEVIPPNHWNKLEAREDAASEPAPPPRPKPKLKPKDAPQFSSYAPGSSQSKDNAIKIGIKQGWSLEKINSFLRGGGVELSAKDFKSMRGGE